MMSTLLCVRSIARPYIVELSKAINETVCLAALEADQVVVLEVASAVSSLAVGTINTTGSLLSNPTHSAIGKLLLSNFGDDELFKEIQRFLSEEEANSETQLHALVDEIADIRRRGHCYAKDDVREGISTLSHLVETSSGNFVTSILLPTEKLADARRNLAGPLQKAARSLEIDLLAHLSE